MYWVVKGVAGSLNGFLAAMHEHTRSYPLRAARSSLVGSFHLASDATRGLPIVRAF